ncbi:MAG: DNA repair protein RadC [Lachnospiraceae bacterium]|nr:DNA repair protein RadC [Lachnospiraceae bacterium]
MQPYEKFKLLGPGALTDEELLGIIIRTGTMDKDSVQIASRLLNDFPEHNLLGLFQTSWQDLMKYQGIGEVKAIRIKCIAEMAMRMSRSRAAKKLNFNHPDTVADYYMESLRHERNEKVILILLDQQLKFISDMVISIGTINKSILSPREIFANALKMNAAQFMLLHNHPSGDPTPSESDITITKEISNLSIIMELPLVDHIIIGDNRYLSLRVAGYL